MKFKIKLYLSILIILSGLAFIVNLRIFKSYQEQALIIRDINYKENNFIDYIDEMETELPNISVTSMNLKAIKANYLIKSQKYDEALSLLNEISYDPLHMRDIRKAEIFYYQNQLDSLYIYSAKAHLSLPLNSPHLLLYLTSLRNFNQLDKISEVYKKYSPKINDQRWEYFYFAAVYPIKEQFNGEIEAQAKKALSKYSKTNLDENLKVILYYILYGEENYKSSIQLFNDGNNYFELEDFKNAAKSYSESNKKFPLNTDGYYNEIVSNYKLNEFKKIIAIYKSFKDTKNKSYGNIEYLVGLSYLKMNDTINACKFFKLSKELSFVKANKDYLSLCD